MTTGTALIDFGAVPGLSDTRVDVTGQAAIVAGSYITASIRGVATADHSIDEHMLETIEIRAGTIVPGTGFTIYAHNNNLLFGTDDKPYGTGSGEGTRLNGTYNVSWAWA